jgi:phage gpG-like protein
MTNYDISEFIDKLEALNRVFHTAPAKIGELAVNFSKERFRTRDWLDNTSQPWPALKRKRKSSGKSGKARKNQTPLVDTGRLKHSIRKIYVDQNIVIIGTDVPYAQLHNEGGEINKTVEIRAHERKEHKVKEHMVKERNVKEHMVKKHRVKAHMRKMNLKVPARKFMGESEELNKKIIALIDNEFQNALNS